MENKLELRFIEYMDVGNKNNWQMSHVLTSQESINIIKSKYSIKKREKEKKSQTSESYLLNSKHKIGFISSVTKAFCRNCNRARVSANGKLFLCLFSNEQGYDLKPFLQNDEEKALVQFIQSVWKTRNHRYSEKRTGELKK